MSVADLNPRNSTNSDQVAVVRLAANQRLIWLGQKLHPEVPIYDMVHKFRIAGAVDPERFCNAFRSLVNSTDILRWVFPVGDTQCPEMIQLPACPRDIEFHDVSRSSFPDRIADEILRTHAASPLPLTACCYDSLLMRTDEASFIWYLKLHHMLTDGLNGKVLIKYLGEHYRAQETGAEAARPGQYAAHVQHENDTRERPAFAQAAEWWNDRSKQRHPTRFFRSRPVPGSTRHVRERVLLSTDLSMSIRQAAVDSPYRQFSPALGQLNIFATAVATWIYRLGGRTTFNLGTTVHGRTTPAAHETIGLFMQLLPLQANVQSGETFATLARKLALETNGLLKHALIGVSTPEMITSFDVVLNMIDLAPGDFLGMPVSMEWQHNGHGDPHRKLTVSVQDHGGDNQIELLFDFNVDAFDAAERERAIAHCRTLLDQIVANPQTRISQADMLTLAEKDFLRQHLRPPQRRANGGNIWKVLESTAGRNSNRMAICDHLQELTYAELIDKARRIAAELISRRAHEIVPVLCRRNARAVVGFVGVLAANRCFMPVDADLPSIRIRELLEDSGANLYLDATEEPSIRELRSPDAVAAESLSAVNACYLLYTSGSTGRPNGVLVGHDSLLNLLNEFECLAPLEEGRCSWWTNVGFDVAMYEVFSAILYGRTLMIPADDTRSDAQRLIAWLDESRINSAYLPPFFLAELHDFLLHRTTALRRLLVGVEPISWELISGISQGSPQLQVINGYGPTEATVCATLMPIDEHWEDEPAPIGLPFSGNSCRVVDDEGADVPPGVTGELLLGGTGLAVGYHNRPELNASRFIHDKQDGGTARMYRTGDRVRQRPDGHLQYVGRVDDQVKINGYRVEPNEIIQTIRTFPGVADCAVTAERVTSTVRLIAFLAAPGTLVEADLRAFLLERLPQAIVPARFVQVPDFPRKLNGKIDIESLLENAGFPTEVPITAPRTELEQHLYRIWQTVLGSEKFGIEHSLFELGGDSLDVMNIVTRARERGIRLAPSLMFQHPTIAGLARSIESSAAHADAATTGTSEVCTVGSTTPRESQLSDAQRRLWYLYRVHPDSPAYHIQIVLETNGELNANRVRTCMETLVTRHSALRTNIVEVNGEPTCSLRESNLLEFRSVDMASPNPNAPACDYRELILEQGIRPFDLTVDPLVRLAVVRNLKGGQQIALTVHHIAADRHSLDILLEEFVALYSGALDSPASRLPELPMRAPAYHPSPPRDNLPFWREYLKDCCAHVHLPVARSINRSNDEGDVFEFCLTELFSDQLAELARNQSVSMNVLMLAAFELLLHRYSSEDDLLVGIPVSTRQNSQADNEVGFFVESLPVRSRFDATQSFSEFLKATRNAFGTAFDHADTSFAEIVQSVNPDRSAAVPLLQYMLVTQTELPDIRIRDDLVLTQSLPHLGAAKFDLTLFVTIATEQLSCSLEYSTQLFTRDVIERLSSHFKALLSAIVAAPESCVAHLNILSDEEQTELATMMSDEVPFDMPTATVHSLIEQQAASQPQAVAVKGFGGSLTYHELNAQARVLATRLRDAGVACGDRVGLHLDRTPDMIVAILGVLKCGAAYVPISRNEAADRVAQIVDACHPRACIAEADSPLFSLSRAGTVLPVSQAFSEAVSRTDRNPAMAFDHNGPSSGLPSAADAAYVIFTSGSSGRPKGVEVTHEALLYSTLARNDHYATAPETFLLLSPYCFDSSLVGIFWTLTTGGRLILPPPGKEQDVRALARIFRDEEVTHSLCLPSLYGVLLQHGAEMMTSLRVMIVAGESCSRKVVDKHFETLPDTQLHNEYGPTEAAVWATAHQFDRERTHRINCIGHRVSATQILLLDRNLQPVPVGVPGEIFIGGPGLARCYTGQPQLTERAFIRNPFSNDPADKLYRTDDLARQNSDSTYEFLGRTDDQFKINGIRTEPQEIERAIAAIPGIAEAAVAQINHQPQISEDCDSLIEALNRLPPQEAAEILSDLESQADTDTSDNAELVTHSTDDVRITLQFRSPTFIKPPRDSQRKWLIKQMLHEAAADLQHLDSLAGSFIAGSDEAYRPRDILNVRLEDQEIMEDWQTPLMKAMADYATEAHGDVLEIGFGRGVSSEFIQNAGVRSHTIIEANPHCVADHFRPWQARHPNADIRLVQGRWQNVLNQLDTYDAVFFHAFPLNESEFVEFIANSVTFAEHFFPVAAKLLRPSGVFTYLTTEIDSLSRRHQRSLLQHFHEVRLRVLPVSIPQDAKDAWWAPSMVVLQARTGATDGESA